MLASPEKAGTHYAVGVSSAAQEGGFFMPAKSRKQQRFLFARKGAAWVKRHHFDKLKRGAKKKR